MGVSWYIINFYFSSEIFFKKNGSKDMKEKLSLKAITVKSFVTIMNESSSLRGGLDPDFTDNCTEYNCDTVLDCSAGNPCKSSYPGGGSACVTSDP